MQERGAGHRDEISEGIGSGDRILGEQPNRTGLTLRLPLVEEIIDDIAELIARTEARYDARRQEHPTPRRFPDPPVAGERDHLTGKPRAIAVEDRPTLEPEGDLGGRPLQSHASATERACTKLRVR